MDKMLYDLIPEAIKQEWDQEDYKILCPETLEDTPTVKVVLVNIRPQRGRLWINPWKGIKMFFAPRDGKKLSRLWVSNSILIFRLVSLCASHTFVSFLRPSQLCRHSTLGPRNDCHNRVLFWFTESTHFATPLLFCERNSVSINNLLFRWQSHWTMTLPWGQGFYC